MQGTITYQLGKFIGLKIKSDDTTFGDPVGIDLRQSLFDSNTISDLKSTNQDAIEFEKILNSRAFCHEFKV